MTEKSDIIKIVKNLFITKMLSILTHQFLLFKKKEIWFYNGESINEADYTTYCYVQNNFNLQFDSELKEFTTTLDLTQNENDLFNSINTTFKYHIRKAQKQNFQFISTSNPSVDDCKKLIKLFKEFAAEKKIISMNKRRIFALQQSNNILITTIKQENTYIVTHVYLYDKNRIVLMHTFHNLNYLDHQIRGYANKYLHWKDILLFKEMNLKIYDFGGIDLEKVPGISHFKLSYGGKTEEVNSYTRIAPAFKLFFKLYKFIRKKNK